MSTLNTFNAILGLACGLTLSACAELYPPNNTSTPIYNSPEVIQTTSAYSGRGVVQSIVPANQGYQGLAGTGYGLGTLIGALAGGLAGSQVGSGTGKTVAMVAGTAGGAYVGHQLEQRNQQPASYAITIRMDNGSYQTLNQSSTGGLNVGDRVRIQNGLLQRD